MAPAPATAGDIDDLGAAIEADEFVAWYQPIVELATGAVIALEAFARRPTAHGVDAPAAFVPLAEQSDLVVELDLAVIRHALADFAAWRAAEPALQLNVNLSGRHFDRSSGGLTRVVEAVHAAGVDPASVCLEVTETVRPRDAEHAQELLAEVRRLGFAVWFDDFGAGFYDLRDAVTWPLDGVKIDQSFTALLDRDRPRTVLGSLAAALEESGLAVTLEGIETDAQAAAAQALGCRFGQGFRWGRPAPAAAVPGWLSAPRTPDRPD